MAIQRPSQPLIYQCPLCKALTVLRDFSTTPDGIEVRCLDCSGVFFYGSSGPKLSFDPISKAKSTAVEAENEAGPASVSPEPAVKSAAPQTPAPQTPVPKTPAPVSAAQSDEGERCPKCNAPKEDPRAEDCPRCGLVYANVGKTFDPDRFSKAQGPLEEKALQLWKEIEDDWSSASLHERFIQYCHSQNLLDLAAHHYRRRKDRGGEQGADAAAYLSRIVEMVQQQFLAQQSGRASSAETVQRGKNALIVGLLVFGLIAFYFIFRAMSGSYSQIQLP